jgi:hypothetical protein
MLTTADCRAEASEGPHRQVFGIFTLHHWPLTHIPSFSDIYSGHPILGITHPDRKLFTSFGYRLAAKSVLHQWS